MEKEIKMFMPGSIEDGNVEVLDRFEYKKVNGKAQPEDEEEDVDGEEDDLILGDEDELDEDDLDEDEIDVEIDDELDEDDFDDEDLVLGDDDFDEDEEEEEEDDRV